MDRVDEVTTIVQHEVRDYTIASGHKATSYYFEDNARHIYTIIIVPESDHPIMNKPDIMMMARVVGDTVIIDEDITDRPLFEELMRNGIPREQIVLAYAGETLPETDAKEDE